MYPAPWLRASDADREAVVAHLGAAAADGRLTLQEFADRTGQVYASRTWGDLARLVSDLPALPMTNVSAAVGASPTGSGSRLPLIALIFGIVSIPVISCVPLGGAAGVVAIVLGILGMRAARGMPGGRGMALAGLICGSAGVALQAAMIAFIALIEPTLT